MSILKYTTKYVILGVLGLVLIIGIVALVSNQLDKSTSDSVVEGENPKARAGTVGQTPLPVNISTKKPPPGETEDTRHWHGNTWHKTPVREPEKGFIDKLWEPKSRGADKYYEMLMHTGNVPEEYKSPNGTDHYAFYQHIIAKYPNSKAAFEARYRLATQGSVTTQADDLKSLLKYYPDSPRINADIAFWTSIESPEESIAFAKKALRLPAFSLEWNSDILRSPEVDAHTALGRAYQRLGDYKTAMVHLKKAQSLILPEIDDRWVSNRYETYGEHIEAIIAGKPLLGPDPIEVQEESSGQESVLAVPSTSDVSASSDSPTSVEGFDFSSDDDELLPFDRRSPDFSESDPRLRIREVAEKARADFLLHQQQKQLEFEGFLRWMEQIERAKSPADLDDFLMREMARTLQGEASDFETDRLIRAYETMTRYGKTEGLTKLRQRDPEMAKAMSRAR